MKNLISKGIALISNAELHAGHTAIHGKKSAGVEDSGNYQNWRTKDTVD